jgi:hypothetical protein
MTDLVERLRNRQLNDLEDIDAVMREAADEIDRLWSTTEISPAHVRGLQADNARLRAALHEIANASPGSEMQRAASALARRALEPKP